MNDGRVKASAEYIVAVAFGAAGLLGLWYWGNPAEQVVNPSDVRVTPPPLVARPSPSEDSAALAYARAFQQGDCERIIEMTQWMHDRLDYVRRTDGEPQALEEARAALCAQIQDRRPERNLLTLEGVEDQYVFSPGAELIFVGGAEGRKELDESAASIGWIQVVYPDTAHALYDAAGNAIRSITAGVHFSRSGKVIKAGVRGNAEIDWDSISYDWPS